MLSFSLLNKSGLTGLLLYVWTAMPFFISRGRNASAYNEIDSSAGIQIIVILIMGIFLVSDISKNYIKYRALINYTLLKWLYFYISICLLSSFWSDNPIYVLWRSFESLVLFLMVVSLCIKLEFNYLDISRWAVSWSFIFGVLLYFIFILNLNFDINALHGIGVFYFGSILFLPLLYKDYKMFFGLFIVMIIATTSKVYLGFLMSTFFLSFFINDRKIKFLLILTIILSFLLVYLNGISFQEILFPNKTRENIVNGTGRIPVWNVLFDAALKKPFIGYGFTMGEREAAKLLNLRVVTAHNSFLSGMLSVGFFGVILLLSFYIKQFNACFKFRRNLNGLLLACCVIMSFFFSIFDNSIGTRISPAWLSTVLLAAVVVSYKAKFSVNESINY